MEQQSPNPERRTTSSEQRAAYETFQNSIKGGRCRLKELRAARNVLITPEQYTLLVSSLAERLEKMVGIDPLTDVFNRAFLEPEINRVKEELTKEDKKFKSVVAIFLDIKDFKILNDTYGHDVGDQALHIVAERLKKGTKKSDAIFRAGGDEFIALLLINDDNPQTIKAIVERIQNNINNELSVMVDGTNVKFSVSMGYETLTSDMNATELLKKADEKMYKDKNGSDSGAGK